ncbi:MAG TPA: hypothetical protein VGS97_08140 [Actinocrinis sp.]|uniref:hypothetical protein n=1 Tax=Actinocrinis sp. TaxID=1920516 RepID=UPI002DDCC130|nr:hypothetical protein [Actinocrinis sp.]HEV2344047.1 hypothetical protein [Actinocrinis sp.]
MTITVDRPAEHEATQRRNPRELVSPQTFTKLVTYIVEHQRVTRPYAERVIEQTLIYLKAVCGNHGVRLVPDISVDPGWHAFLMHTIEYAQSSRITTADGACTTSRSCSKTSPPAQPCSAPSATTRHRLPR